MMGWLLRRSPLSSGVPLEGSDTVQGLRNLERMRLAELLQEPTPATFASGRAGSSGAFSGGGWRHRFQRYRGPFVEQLAVEDLKADPKPWAVFWRGSEAERWAAAYSLPSSLDVLHERTEENFVSFLPNYLRLAAAVLLATFYLRPKALLGAAALAISMYRSISRALERQSAEAAAGAVGGSRVRGGSRPTAAAAAGPAGGAAADPNEQLVTAALTVLTWLMVAYTRCIPVLLLGMATSLVVVLVHCGLRRAPSEYRYKGRQPLGFSLRQLLGQEPVPNGCRPSGLFKEIAQASWRAATARWQWAKRYARYYMLTVWDTLRHPRSLLAPSTSSGLS